MKKEHNREAKLPKNVERFITGSKEEQKKQRTYLLGLVANGVPPSEVFRIASQGKGIEKPHLSEKKDGDLHHGNKSLGKRMSGRGHNKVPLKKK